MGFDVNNVGKTFQANEVSGIKNIAGDEKINCIFNGENKQALLHTPFNGEEQHILGLFANTNVLIED